MHGAQGNGYHEKTVEGKANTGNELSQLLLIHPFVYLPKPKPKVTSNAICRRTFPLVPPGVDRRFGYAQVLREARHCQQVTIICHSY